MKNIKDALTHELKDILSAEKQLKKLLPKLSKHANDSDLKSAFKDHLEQTNVHIERVEASLKSVGAKATPKKCVAMEGLCKEGEHLMEHDATDAVKDCLLIAAARKVEHYEMASYGTAIKWAKVSGNSDVADNLQKTLDEEKETEKKLAKLATRLNKKAAE